MSHSMKPLSATEIHNVYAPTVTKRKETTQDSPRVSQYAKTSFSGRDPGHPGSPPAQERKGKKQRG
jgi:hypothetical protein